MKYARTKPSACLHCGYSLRGLPENHACPECGLRFDGESLIWRARRGKMIFLSMIGLVGAAPLLARNILEWRSLSAHRRMLHIVVIVATVAFAAWLFRRLLRRYREGQYVAVTPDALVISVHGQRPEFIPWGNIDQVSVTPTGIGVEIYVEKEIGLRVVSGVFRDRSDAEEFVTRAKRRISTARAAAAATSDLRHTGDS